MDRTQRSWTNFFAWTVWILSALFMFYKYALEVSPSVMTSHLMSAFHISGAQLGHLAACYFYAYLLMQIPAGLLIDRFGPRKTTTFAIGVCSIGALLFALSKTLFLAEVGRFMTGLGAAFAALNCLKLTGNWFPSHRFAFMAGLMMTLGMLGAVGGQAPLSAFIEQEGWRSALKSISFVGLALCLLFYFIVRDRPKHQSAAHLNQEGLSLWQSCLTVFKSKQSWILSIYSGLAFAPVTIFGGLWGVPFLQEAFKLTKAHAAHVVSLIFIGFAIGAPLIGWLSDYIGNRKRVMMVGTFCAFLCISTLLYAPISIGLLYTLTFAFGFFISAFLVCFTMIREINSSLVAATAIGFMNAFDALLGALSDPLTGKILDRGWDGTLIEGARVFSVDMYRLSLTTIPICLLLSLVFLAFIKETYKQKIPLKIST